MKNKKAQVTIYLSGLIAMIIIVLVAGFVAPMGTRFTAEIINAGEQQLLRANESIQSIQNDTIREGVTGTISEAFDAGTTNIEVTTDMFQYLWVIVLAVVSLILFLFTRRIIEVGGGGFV